MSQIESRDLAYGAGFIEYNTETGFVSLNGDCIGRIGTDTAGGGWLVIRGGIHGVFVKMTADFLSSPDAAFDLLGELVMAAKSKGNSPQEGQG